MTLLVRQDLRHRLAITAKASQPWPTQPVAIALVITDLDVGGAERALTMLATRLDPKRWQVRVFCLGSAGTLVRSDSSTRIFPANASRQTAVIRYKSIARLAIRLRQFHPKLVQSFMFHANLASRLAAPWAHWPWVVAGLRVAERQKRWHLILDRLTAPLTTGSVCVSQGVLRFSHQVGTA